MFGLFKKKKEEPQQETVQSQKENQSQEFKAFAADFLPEETDIVAVTAPTPFSSKPVGETGLFKVALSLTAWMDEYTHELQQGEGRLEAMVERTLLEYLLTRVPGNFIITATVRPSEDGKRFMMTDLPKPGFDPDLKAILEEQKKPVTLEVENLGTFTLSRTLGWFESSVDWGDSEVSLTFDQAEETREGAQDTARALLAEQDRWDERIRAYAAETLLDKANGLLAEDEEADTLSSEEFLEQLALDSVFAAPDGAFEFWFTCYGLPMANPVRVSGNLTDGPTAAVMDGES